MSPDRHLRHVAGRFSAAAPIYHAAARFQESVARRVVELIPGEAQPARILDAGCGTGSGMAFARARWPRARITGVDIAPGMIRAAHERFADDDRMDFAIADLMAPGTATGFDAIISSSALHWIRPFERSLAALMPGVNPGGMMAAGIMLDGTLSELRAAREAVAPAKPIASRLPNFDALAHAARMVRGARIVTLEQSTVELTFDNARHVLQSIHDMGVTGGDISLGTHAPLTRKELVALQDWYDLHCRCGHGVQATFAVGYVLLQG